MGLIAKAEEGSGGSFIPVPVGMHLARCYRIIDLGTQESTYKGEVTARPRVLFQFEVHSEDNQGNPLLTTSGDPMTVAKTFTRSLAEKATLRRDLETWRGKPFTKEETRGFELKNVLGQWAMINVSENESNGKVYTNIANINPVPATIKKNGLPEGKNELKIFFIEEADMDLFESFSDYLKDKIRKSPEWERLHGGPSAGNFAPGANFDDMESDLPF
jgi:hypothetical protein